MAAPTRRRPRRRTEEPTWDLVLKRNSIERLKREKFPLDIVDDLPQLIAVGYEAVPEEDIVRLNWWGLTHDKPKIGTFMVRIKVPGGLLKPAQLRGVGRISQTFGKDYGELTTRQGLQLHWVRLDQLPEVLDAVRATGLTTVGGEGDTVRNITGCPVAGIAADEAFDVRPVIEDAARYFYGNPDYSDLPRKHKFTISACPGQCNAPEIHDVALVGVVHDDREGFALRVGGGLSNTPRLSRDIGVFVPVDDAIDVLRATTDAWQTNLRYRVSRAKARIKFMVDDYGPEGVRTMIEERLGRRLEDLTAPAPARDYEHLGVHSQKQEGYVYAGFSVPMGWMTGEQMIAIGDLVEDLGTGLEERQPDIRLTRQQDFIVGNVPIGLLGRLLDGMRELGFPITRNKVYGNSIACTSHRFCNYSVAETKGKLDEVLEVLEQRFGEKVESLKIFMDGCPHSCAHHWVGDIGLQGTTTRLPDGGQRVEAYDVTLRGGLGRKAAIGKPVLRRVPTDDLIDVLVHLVGGWLEEKASRNGDGDGYTFRDFCDERDDEQLRALAFTATSDDENDTRPIVRVPGTLIELADGADEIAVDATSVREALAVLAAEHAPLVAYLLQDAETVNPAVNLYIGEDDIRALGGLDAPLQAGDELTILPALAGG
ncbi:MAG TPA: MoaD/ThiS family protein [Nitriliruptorales bacterium]|nr:MoaD/ThiS family protein [Nitriliruptorales bacterium]